MTQSSLDTTQTALLVIDKQLSYSSKDQVIFKLLGSDSKSFEKILPRIDNLIKLCRTNGIEVIWTKMIEDPSLSPKNIRDKMKLSNTPAISSPNTTGFEFNGLGPDDEEKIIVKYYFDAFAQTDLNEHLKSKGIKNVIIVGGFASRCVLGTAFGANGYGYSVVVVKDLVANPDKISHEVPVALSIISSTLGYVMPENELLSRCFNIPIK